MSDCPNGMSDDDRKVFEVHEICVDFVAKLIAEGNDAKLVSEAMATTAASSLVQTHGPCGTLKILLACYIPIRNEVIRYESAMQTAH